MLDLYTICSEELKTHLNEGRELEMKIREEEDARALSGEEVKVVGGPKAKGEKKASIDDQVVYRPHGTGKDTGNYHLTGVVTHKGRSADSGHYIGWVHRSGGKAPAT